MIVFFVFVSSAEPSSHLRQEFERRFFEAVGKKQEGSEV